MKKIRMRFLVRPLAFLIKRDDKPGLPRLPNIGEINTFTFFKF